jgi:hypothetical protein
MTSDLAAAENLAQVAKSPGKLTARKTCARALCTR